VVELALSCERELHAGQIRLDEIAADVVGRAESRYPHVLTERLTRAASATTTLASALSRSMRLQHDREASGSVV